MSGHSKALTCVALGLCGAAFTFLNREDSPKAPAHPAAAAPQAVLTCAELSTADVDKKTFDALWVALGCKSK